MSVRSVDTPPLELCPLAHVHSTSTHSLQNRKICLSVSTVQRLMRFSASRRLATVPLWFLFFFQFPLVGHINLLGRTLPFRNSCFFFFFFSFSFFLRRALFLHFFLLRFLALRARQAPWSQHPRVDATLRLHLVVARHSSVSFDVEIASSSPLVLPPSAATAVFLRLHSATAALLLLTCLLLGAPLTIYCNCCLTYTCRVSDFAHEHSSNTSIALGLFRRMSDTPRDV